MGDSCLIDGFGPVPVVRPASVTEVGEIVRGAAREENSLYPLGGRTMLDLGCPPKRQGLGIDLRGLDQLIDYPARDMTITVQAGISMARLQEILTPEKQRLPIDVPRADQATLGGVLAANVSGSRRLGFGTLRDYVLGISAVNDLGQEIKAGGRVVKNVAGYDLCKLFIGSLGTLGIMTQVTLKLRPLPEEQALVCVACGGDDLQTLLEQLSVSRTRPVCLDMLNRPAAAHVFEWAGAEAPDSPWMILVGFEGGAPAVQWQVQQLVRELGPRWSLEARIGSTAEPLWKSLVEFGFLPWAALTVKATMFPSSIAAFCQACDDSSGHCLLRAHGGNGIVLGHVLDATLDRAEALTASWRKLAEQGKGRVVVQRCSPAWKNAAFVWGPPPRDVALMHAVKDKFDPRGLFNPGRFVDGI